jgi:predicted O-methyltransferase YrrM
LQTRELVQHLFGRHGGGLVEKLVEIRDHNVTSRARHGLPGGSTGNPDCAFLYLLVKGFQRRSIFEVGTYVGTSAVAITMAGGHVMTKRGRSVST